MECKKDGEKEGGGALNKATRSVEVRKCCSCEKGLASQAEAR